MACIDMSLSQGMKASSQWLAETDRKKGDQTNDGNCLSGNLWHLLEWELLKTSRYPTGWSFAADDDEVMKDAEVWWVISYHIHKYCHE